MNWYYQTLSVQLGAKSVRMFSIYVLNLPIPQFKNIKNPNKNQLLQYQKEIDHLVYDLYGLDKDEKKFIDFFNSIR